jgi:hypothetical protein
MTGTIAYAYSGFNRFSLNSRLEASGLQQLVDLKAQPRQLQTVLNGMQPLAQRLPAGYSFLKAQALAELGMHYDTIGQQGQSQTSLNQGLEATRTIQGKVFQAIALTLHWSVPYRHPAAPTGPTDSGQRASYRRTHSCGP